MKKPIKVKSIIIYSLKEWRNWLEKNHLKENKVGIILHKKHTGKPFITHKEAMHEAICFGWIDTTLKRLDEDRYVRYFVRRGDNANWSKNTLRYGKELLAAGKMSHYGIFRYKQGLKKKPHDYGIPDNPKMPLELKLALSKNKNAKEGFDKFSPSTKKMFYRAILRVKTLETKNKRVKEIIKSLIKKS